MLQQLLLVLPSKGAVGAEPLHEYAAEPVHNGEEVDHHSYMLLEDQGESKDGLLSMVLHKPLVVLDGELHDKLYPLLLRWHTDLTSRSEYFLVYCLAGGKGEFLDKLGRDLHNVIDYRVK
jgi:hypothetical protein